VIVLVQLILTRAGASLAALTVHFRDIRDILSNVLTLWYLRDADHLPVAARAGSRQVVPQRQPLHAPGHFVPGSAVLQGPLRPLEMAAGTRRGIDRFFLFAYFVFDRLRDTFAEEV
jgi:hypothetical protein